MYDVIVLGATFAAAGVVLGCKGSCLVVDRSLRAGYEFFGALQWGSGYEKTLQREEARQLQQLLRGGFFGGDRHIYPLLEKGEVRFGTQVISVESTENGFRCLTHSVEGYAAYEAKTVIDTRTHSPMCLSKTYNFLMESREVPAFPGVSCQATELEGRYLVCCPVDLAWDYPQAREVAWNTVSRFSGEQKLILFADEFDYQLKPGYPKKEQGVLFLPSKAYENPCLALEAGILAGEGL